jgi:hypothetical protein
MKIHYPSIGKALPLQIVLVVPFLIQIFAAVSLVGYLSFKNGQKAVNDLAEHLMDRTSEVVDEHLKSHLSIPQTLNQINADAIRRGILDVRDRKTLGTRIIRVIGLKLIIVLLGTISAKFGIPNPSPLVNPSGQRFILQIFQQAPTLLPLPVVPSMMHKIAY